MDELERDRLAFVAAEAARYVGGETAARDAFRDEIRTIKVAVSNRPKEDLVGLIEALRDKGAELETLADASEQQQARYGLATLAGGGALAAAFVAMATGGASLALSAAIAAIGAAFARLSNIEGETLKTESDRLRAAATDLRELAQEIGDGYVR